LLAESKYEPRYAPLYPLSKYFYKAKSYPIQIQIVIPT
jgi:hypothetical protein